MQGEPVSEIGSQPGAQLGKKKNVPSRAEKMWRNRTKKTGYVENFMVCVGRVNPVLLRYCMETNVRKDGKSQINISVPEDN